ncbi:MAG: HAD-IIIA family hydrolase [Alphaproteobacteria bacterium]|nr:HAD-IIIA family hydrolase [Alphaproteobacteria bacterium]
MTKPRALLLDRDGVINVDKAYVGTIDRFDFMQGIFPFLRAALDLGYRLAVLTNQAGVARGYYSEADYHRLTAHMLDCLRREGIAIELTLACFEHAAGNPPYAHASYWRKPNPGMVLEAARRMRLDTARSAFLGDQQRDMQAGLGGGIGKNLWLTQEQTEAPAGVTLVKDYAEALTALSA